MKKMFLILVSVLVLGGCSVDDDVGGDDMAITTYPNIVEASRIVVEGGYLVEYFYNGVDVKDFLNFVIKKVLGTDVYSSGKFVNEKFKNLLKMNLSFELKQGKEDNELYDIYNYRLESVRIVEFYDNSDYGVGVRIGLNLKNVLNNDILTITKNLNGVIELSSAVGNFCNGQFTIFEPSE